MHRFLRSTFVLLCLVPLVSSCSSLQDVPVTSLPVPDDPAPVLDTPVSCYEPTWQVPDDAYKVQLEVPETAEPGAIIEGVIVVDGASMANLSHLQSIPLILVAQIQDPNTASFENGLDHVYTQVNIGEATKFKFPIKVVMRAKGAVKIFLGWKWRIATEGCCSVAINSVYLGCKLGGQLNSACVCAALNGLAWPGSWCCKRHPLTFRQVWKDWGCTGVSPY